MFFATVIGNVGQDAELKYLADGKPVLNGRLATSKRSKAGEVTTWITFALFGKSAEAVAKYVTKGKQVAVSGEVSNRPYEKDGVTKYSLEIDAKDIRLLGGPVSDSDTNAAKSSYKSTEGSPF